MFQLLNAHPMHIHTTLSKESKNSIIYFISAAWMKAHHFCLKYSILPKSAKEFTDQWEWWKCYQEVCDSDSVQQAYFSIPPKMY